MFTITRITAAIAVIAVAITAGTSLAGPPATRTTVEVSRANASAGQAGKTVTSFPPAGIYRKTITQKEIRAAGMPEDYIARNWGTNTLTFRGATGNWRNANPTYRYSCNLKFKLERGLLSISAPGTECDGPPWRITWKRVATGIDLRFLYEGNRRFAKNDKGTEADGIWKRVK